MNSLLKSCRARPTLVAAAVLAAIGLTTIAVQAGPRSDNTGTRATQDRDYALVQLNGEPLATYAKTRPPAGRKS